MPRRSSLVPNAPTIRPQELNSLCLRRHRRDRQDIAGHARQLWVFLLMCFPPKVRVFLIQLGICTLPGPAIPLVKEGVYARIYIDHVILIILYSRIKECLKFTAPFAGSRCGCGGSACRLQGHILDVVSPQLLN